jgi:FkbM family methyltransferase
MRSLVKSLFRRLAPTRIKDELARVAIATMPPDALDRLSVRYDMVSMAKSFRHLRRLRFVPDRVIDVGAFRGEFTRLIEEIYPKASVLMIEPQAESAAILRQIVAASGGRHTYRRALLGAAPRANVVFYELGNGSSVFPEAKPVRSHRGHHAMTTLDDVVPETVFPPAKLLELDVQGSDRGAVDRRQPRRAAAGRGRAIHEGARLRGLRYLRLEPPQFGRRALERGHHPRRRTLGPPSD